MLLHLLVQKKRKKEERNLNLKPGQLPKVLKDSIINI